ncbi:hypothetical protein SAMN05421504_111236 [Amycolatopsis xylanica]|uniref:SpcZ n=1 Tax=Amycolatopsis xylanica TaxID=589385 RepID=A0A1H3RQ20_9PSEU|nr:hypothetical protein [Amycolatopsis xylanica]SDZ27455.1 hypothetical protein SAMN05421504_111236 [Amycolatopsis xylanica]
MWLPAVAEVLGISVPAGEPPFSVVHDWHATTIGPLLIETLPDAGAHEAVRALHARALAGEQITEDVWRDALEPALRDLYRNAYPTKEVFAKASEAAGAFALARGYSEVDARNYGESYAEMNTEANVRVHADANALANAAACARAFAQASHEEYAATYPFAYVRACVLVSEDARARLGAGLTRSLSL